VAVGVIVKVLVASSKEIVGLSVGLRQTTCDASTENSVVLISTNIEPFTGSIIFTTQTCVINDPPIGFVFVICQSVSDRYNMSPLTYEEVFIVQTSPNFVTRQIPQFGIS